VVSFSGKTDFWDAIFNPTLLAVELITNKNTIISTSFVTNPDTRVHAPHTRPLLVDVKPMNIFLNQKLRYSEDETTRSGLDKSVNI
jgi:hypothetical protein